MAKNGNANNQNTGAGSQTSSGSTTNQTTSGTTQQQPQTTVNQQISNPKYVVTVGFEVNYPSAFVNDVQNLGEEDPIETDPSKPHYRDRIDIIGDYGHAFFYVTKDDEVTDFFSFGPGGGHIADSKGGRGRLGDTAYTIGEISQFFRLLISEEQADKIKAEMAKFQAKVDSQEILFNPAKNDTCAATARAILKAAGVNTPKGKGHITGTGSGLANTVAGIFNFTNPYMWHKNFVAKYGAGIPYYGPAGNLADDGYGNMVEVRPSWYLTSGDDDPLKGTSHVSTEHDDVTQSSK